MMVCSTPDPLLVVLRAPTSLGEPEETYVLCCLMCAGVVKLCSVVSSIFPQPHSTAPKWLTVKTVGLSFSVWVHQIYDNFSCSWPAEIFWHPHRPAAFCKVAACFPRPAQGSANPPCVSQIPSVFVRQQRGHLLMTFHVFTGVLLRVCVDGVGGVGYGKGKSEKAN